MIGTIILMLLCFWIVGLVGGVLIGKMLWTPPVKSVK